MYQTNFFLRQMFELEGQEVYFTFYKGKICQKVMLLDRRSNDRPTDNRYKPKHKLNYKKKTNKKNWIEH